MCSPLAAGLALSAGGTFLQTREQNRNEARMTAAKNQAFADNMKRNTQFAADAGSIQANNTKKQGREAFDENQEQAVEQTKQAFNDIRTQPDYNVGLSDNTPKNVVLARQKASADATAKTDRDLDNNAQLQSYGGALFNSGMDQSQFARLFGNIQDKAAANTRMLPLEMSAAANNASKSPGLFPTLMKAAGTGLSLYGAAGGSFSNTVPGAMPAGVYGPGAPQTSYGLFMNQKPVNLFGYQLAGRL